MEFLVMCVGWAFIIFCAIVGASRYNDYMDFRRRNIEHHRLQQALRKATGQ